MLRPMSLSSPPKSSRGVVISKVRITLIQYFHKRAGFLLGLRENKKLSTMRQFQTPSANVKAPRMWPFLPKLTLVASSCKFLEKICQKATGVSKVIDLHRLWTILWTIRRSILGHTLRNSRSGVSITTMGCKIDHKVHRKYHSSPAPAAS
jgi:hypothetical protein